MSLLHNRELLDRRISHTRAEAEASVVPILEDIGVAESDILETVALLIEYDGNTKIVKGVEKPATTINFFLY